MSPCHLQWLSNLDRCWWHVKRKWCICWEVAVCSNLYVQGLWLTVVWWSVLSSCDVWFYAITLLWEISLSVYHGGMGYRQYLDFSWLVTVNSLKKWIKFCLLNFEPARIWTWSFHPSFISSSFDCRRPFAICLVLIWTLVELISWIFVFDYFATV